jgi:hypothetical protein
MNKRQDYRDYGKAPFGTIAGYFAYVLFARKGPFRRKSLLALVTILVATSAIMGWLIYLNHCCD